MVQTQLALRKYIDLPSHPAGDFDHGDVYLPNGYVFIANTAAGTVEVVDGERFHHIATVPNVGPTYLLFDTLPGTQVIYF